MSFCCRSKHQRGFTLLEALVAVAILATSLAAALRAGGMAASTAEDLRRRTVSSWVAENRLAELRALRLWPAPGEASGELQMAGESVRWQQVVSSTPNQLFLRVEIKVTPLAGGATVRHIGYLVRP